MADYLAFVRLLNFLVITVVLVVFGGEVFYGQVKPSNSTKETITPAHEIWLKYEKLKFDMSPAGKKAAKEAEVKAAEEAERKRFEDEKKAAEEAERKRKEQYDKLIDEKKYRAFTEQHFQKLAEEFRKMIPYEDSEKLAKECEEKYIIEVNKRLKKEYEQLVQAKNRLDKTKDRASTEKEYQELATKFRAMIPYEDSAELADECDTQIEVIEAEIVAEAERKLQEIYDQVVQEKNRAATVAEHQKVAEYQKVAEKFREMIPYKDSEKLAEECDREAKRIADQIADQIAEAERKAAEPINLWEEIRKNGFNTGIKPYMGSNRSLDLDNYLLYGSSRLKARWDEAKRILDGIPAREVAEKTAAQTKLDQIQAEIKDVQNVIAKKTFFCEYEYKYDRYYNYSEDGLKVGGDTSNFVMAFYVDFKKLKFGKITFPMLDVIVTEVKESIGGDYIRLTVSGPTDDILKLYDNKGGNYKVKVWYTNLRTDNYGGSADVQRVEIVDR